MLVTGATPVRGHVPRRCCPSRSALVGRRRTLPSAAQLVASVSGLGIGLDGEPLELPGGVDVDVPHGSEVRLVGPLFPRRFSVLRMKHSQAVASTWASHGSRMGARVDWEPRVTYPRYVGADAFWNERYTRVSTAPGIEAAAKVDPVLVDALAFFGDLAGRTLVDLGCGAGKASLFFASRGAHVIAIDSSSVAIESISHFCAENEIRNLEPVCASALDVASYGPVDLVFGSMVLHHLEPFTEFGLVLRSLMKADAKAFFYENNGRNPLLMLLRRHVVGRFCIPKHGDPEESPLTPEEIDTLRRHFRVRVDYPELLLMRLAGDYLFRGHLQRSLGWLDAMLYRIVPLRRYGYRQYVYLERRPSG